MADLVFSPLVDTVSGQHADVAVAVLSLPDCSERRAALLHRGLPTSWVDHYWPGYDLRFHSDDQAYAFLNPQLAHQSYSRRWRTSEVGCALSHRSALLTFLFADLILAVHIHVVVVREFG